MPRTKGVGRQLWCASLLAFTASLIFWAFFQLSKLPEFAAVSPFAEDPVDAIGSITVQVALAVSLLTLARAVQLAHIPTPTAYKCQLIVLGNTVSLLAIIITLAADMLMEVRQPAPGSSPWSQRLLAGLGIVALMTCAAILTTFAAARHSAAGSSAERQASGEAGSLGEALTDLWALVRLILAWISHHLPWLSRPLHWVDVLGNGLFEWAMNWPWIGPRAHPWRFCATVGLALGMALAVVHGLEEGPAFSLALSALTGMIFIVVEVVAVLSGFLLLGGFLGIRPPLRLQRKG